MKGIRRNALYGAACIVYVLYLSVAISSASSQVERKSNSGKVPVVSSIQNETILDDINATGEIMKKMGEFASRTLWVRKGRFVLPTGTILTLAPKITVPAFRRKAFNGGLNSDFQATWFLYLNCDKMGYTHDMHPFPFDRPPFYPFGPLMRPIEGKDDKKDKEKEKKPVKGGGSIYSESHYDPFNSVADPSYQYEQLPANVDSYKGLKSDTVYTFFPITKRSGANQAEGKQEKSKPVVGAGRSNVRKPRSVMSLPPPDKLPGGERAILLPSIENMMSNFGFEGRGCMLRAICEIHEFPLQEGYGLLGEMIALFFSISQSPYAESHMPEYLKAEETGRNGDCSAYKNICAKSIFKWETEKKHHDDDLQTNEIPLSPYRSKFEDDEL